jgi:hypothetical protein
MIGRIFEKFQPQSTIKINYGLKPNLTTETTPKTIAPANSVNEIAAGAYS